MKKLLLVIPYYGTKDTVLNQFLKVLANRSIDFGWSLTILGQKQDENGKVIHYPMRASFIRAQMPHPRPKNQSFLSYIHTNVKAMSLQVQQQAKRFDLVFALRAQWLMIDAWELPVPLVSYVSDFGFERMGADDFFRLFLLETTWRVKERSAITIFPDDLTEQYAKNEYLFERTEVITNISAGQYFAVFDKALQL